MSSQKQKSQNFKFRGKQILLLGLVALVISAGYYRWTIEREELASSIPTANEALPVEADGGDNKGDENKDNNVTEQKSDNNQNDNGGTQNEDIAKLRKDRDSARSASVEEWKKLKSDEKSSQESRKDAENKIKQATESADAERRVETQIKAKGYDDCFAYISENGISVTVKGGQIDGSKVAAMKDIIVTETHIPVKNIKINAM
ncbi:MAG: SpoIIIAH-like family protein [Eubacteriales bacterium]|jgi:stage III sporulation protein AH|nr:SpoIIIAH-like family protein [Eubacteriales bacterium]MDY4213778.1 SpoIIIAH-like family protein [Eubacteriales bacterium]MDY5231787.1 SpoIIIAH-like family protein [Eubacteriales bacterium]